MKGTYRVFRIATAIAGFVCIFGAAGTDQRFTEMRQMPPESVEQLFVIGFILLIPTILHAIKERD